MTKVVSIKFRTAGKHYDFNARDFELAAGDHVIVETDRGRALGTVVTTPGEIDPENDKRELKSVLRLATDEDMQLAETNAAREETAFKYCREKIFERQMEMKLVKAEYLFDGSKIIFYFTADGRVDFRELVKDLAHYFHTRIEMRQIGVRDEAKLIGGIGICGLSLCCCSFLTEFTPVSVKMAKEQQLALNPSKISGQCGRLLCCLSYEYETYCKLRKGMPKQGLKLEADGVGAMVIETDILGQKIAIRTEDGRNLKLLRDEFTELMETGKLPVKKEPVELGATPEPATKAPAAPSEDAGEEKAKKRRRRRRRKPTGDQQGAASEQPREETSGKPQPARSKPASKPPEAKEAPDAASDPQKKKRRRRRRKPAKKPGASDKD